MKISIAQTRPVKGDITANIEAHKKMVAIAISHHSNAVFFPELSLTGYEPALAKNLSNKADDTNLNVFQAISDQNNITIGVGMPTNAGSGIAISMLIFTPNAARQTYSKQQLHVDEMPYFVNGEKQVILTVGQTKIAPAICYESLQTSHSSYANQLGAQVYLASVAKPQNGVDKALLHYPTIAKKFAMPILMANCVGYCDNFESVGQSAIWTKNGILVAKLAANNEGLLTFDTETEEVIVFNEYNEAH